MYMQEEINHGNDNDTEDPGSARGSCRGKSRTVDPLRIWIWFLKHITTPVAVNEMKKMDNQTVFNHDKIALVMDHFIPNKDIKSAENCKCCREFACRHDIAQLF